MATTANGPNGSVPVGYTGSDPFVSTPSQALQRHRYSSFDKQLSSLYANGSPSQTKRALEAHLAETERRLQEASQLGKALVKQRTDLSDRLRDVERQQEESEIGPELRQKLIDLEKEYNDVGLETARAFVPKSRIPSGEAADASVFSSEAQNSPSKVSVPSRKQRNQQPSRVHDITLATEISTSLLNQVRELQAQLMLKDEELKSVDYSKSQLEVEIQGLTQRLRALDESEQRYKDENWNLETQVHELIAAAKLSTEREQRLNQSLNASKAEKSALEREFEELKQAHSKLSDDHTTSKKHHESELLGLRKNVTSAETERGELQRKVEELTSQNQELAKAVAYRMRADEQAAARGTASENEDGIMDLTTPENSPPASPSKATPRHGQLESETLKSSLHHAHRMIQNLKNNIHREKTEKIELKRMLQDARDEVEAKRQDGGFGSAGKRRKQAAQQDVFKKPARPDRLGAARNSKDEVTMLDEGDWEDHDTPDTPSKRSTIVRSPLATSAYSADEASEAYQTANDTEEAFETANEQEGTTTETDAFQTGAETLDGDSSDDLTETEGTVSDARARRPSPLIMAGNRTSYMSTASTSDEDFDDMDVKTPVQSQHPRYRLKINRERGGYRRSTRGSSDVFGSTSSVKDSPASIISNGSQPAAGQSLFAELGNLSDHDSDDGSNANDTPSKSSIMSADTPDMQLRQQVLRKQSQSLMRPKPAMVSSGMMTEPWEPESKGMLSTAEDMVAGALVGSIGVGVRSSLLGHKDEEQKESSTETPDTSGVTQEDDTRALPNKDVHAGAEEAEDAATPKAAPLDFSSVAAQNVEPVAPVAKMLPPPVLSVSSLSSVHSEPVDAVKSVPLPSEVTPLAFSSVNALHTEPTEAVKKTPVPESSPAPVPVPLEAPALSVVAPLTMSSVKALHTVEPMDPILAPPPPVAVVPLGMSSLVAAHTEPEEAIAKPPAVLPLGFSSLLAKHTEPESPKVSAPVPEPISVVEEPKVEPQLLDFSPLTMAHTEPTVPSRPVTAHRDVPIIMPSPTTDVTPPPMAGSEAAKPGLGFFSSMLGFNKPSEASQVDEDENSQPTREIQDTTPLSANGVKRAPLEPVVANGVRPEQIRDSADSLHVKPLKTRTADEGVQTLMSGPEIDKLLKAKSQPPAPVPFIAPGTLEPPISPTRSVFGPPSPRKSQDSQRTPRRPGSANSMRSRKASPPPLPADHREVIAAAAQKVPPPSTPGAMGPPAIPASAYKKTDPNATLRVRTPSQGPQPSPTSKGASTIRPRAATGRSDISSITRRSSVSSFASELDERFNIRKNALSHEYEPPTDPRMIQAITQTMIGEFLWKYTRKAGRGDMSENRHRRFFWVHPYTRTLYWSEQDPSTAGRAQLKAKSVAIEAVRVVTDDNPMPPGLHRKSLIVITPGRSIKFTATTGQRHETWFNALSYLLLRTAGERDDESINEEVSEFNPHMRSTSRQTGRSRASLSSYNSRTTRTSSPVRANNVPSLAVRQSRAAAQVQHAQSQAPQGSTSGRFSSLSGMFRPRSVVRGSFSSRHSKGSAQEAQIYDAPPVHDSAEDLREVIEQQEREADRLENVRACCDGRHDVGSLPRKGRDASHSHNSRHSVSHTRNGSHGPNSQYHHENEMVAANFGAN